MTKNILFIAVIFCGFCLAVIMFFQGNGLFIGHDENQEDQNRQIGLWTTGTLIQQTFVASHNDLSRVDFAVESYQPWNSPYLDCRLFRLDAPETYPDMAYDALTADMTEVRHTTINGWMLSIHTFNPCSFEPIPDSQGTHYLFSLQSPRLKTGGTSILLASPKNRYEQGILFVDGERQEGDLAFRALYQRPRRELIQHSFEKIARHKPVPFSRTGTYYLIFLLYIVLLAVCVVLVTR